jgi:hypothetical protein
LDDAGQFNAGWGNAARLVDHVGEMGGQNDQIAVDLLFPLTPMDRIPHDIDKGRIVGGREQDPPEIGQVTAQLALELIGHFIQIVIQGGLRFLMFRGGDQQRSPYCGENAKHKEQEHRRETPAEPH